MDALRAELAALTGIVGTMQGDNKRLLEMNTEVTAKLEEQKKVWAKAMEDRAEWEIQSKKTEDELKNKVK